MRTDTLTTEKIREANYGEGQQRQRDFDNCNQAETKGQGYAGTIAATSEQIMEYRIGAIKERFRYHSPRPDQLPKYQALRDAAASFAVVILRNAPEGRDSDKALELLETALMTANKAIALG